MIETTKTATDPTMTDDDWNALMDAAIWLKEFGRTGALLSYQKQWIAIYSERIIAADSDKQELHRRVRELGDSINKYRVLVRYVHSLEELYSQP